MDTLTATFAALADPTRRAIIARLAQGETHVGELVRPLTISGPAVSRHLRVLERARLIERSVDAQWRVCRLRGPGLHAAHDWLDQYRAFWQDNLDRLADLLEPHPDAPASQRRTSGRTPQRSAARTPSTRPPGKRRKP